MRRSLSAVLFATAFCGISTAIADEAATIRAALAKVLPDQTPTSIQPAPINGLFQVIMGAQVLFVTGDGRYLIDGAVIDLTTRKNLTETAQTTARQQVLATLKPENMIRFDAAKPQHTVTVFTDIDCGYCRKLHQHIADYNDAGISIHYLLFPRSGIDSDSYDKAVAVWCSKDRNAALTAAKNGDTVPTGTCDHPVKQHMELGAAMGIRGTPALILENGELIPGYVEPKQLAKMLEQKAAQ